MNKELQEYYEALFDLFGSKGWKVLTDQLETNKSAINSIRDITDAKTLHFKQGQLDVIDIILTLPALTEQSYQSAQEQPE